MQLDEVRNKLLSVLGAKAADHAIDLVDVRVSLQGNTPLIQVFIDNVQSGEGGTEAPSLDEIGEQTPWISAVIDELDPFERAYNLEVSSPGLARPLRRMQDFIEHKGEKIKLQKKGTSGRLKYTGTLHDVKGENLILVCDNKEVVIALADIDTANIEPMF